MEKSNSIICDTNILVYFIEGNINAGKVFQNNNIIFSSITFIEFLSNKKLTSLKRDVYKNFLDAFTIIDTSTVINSIAINLRLNYNLDTPGALVAATAKYLDLPLITADKSFF